MKQKPRGAPPFLRALGGLSSILISLVFLTNAHAAIFGEDGRIRADAPIGYPFTAVGRISYEVTRTWVVPGKKQNRFEMGESSGAGKYVEVSQGQCLGTIIGKNLVVTNAHCAEELEDGEATFTPGFHEGKAPFGTFSVQSVVLPTAWRYANIVPSLKPLLDYCRGLGDYSKLQNCYQNIRKFNDIAILIVDDLPMDKVGQIYLLKPDTTLETLWNYAIHAQTFTLSRNEDDQMGQFCQLRSQQKIAGTEFARLLHDCDLVGGDSGAAHLGFSSMEGDPAPILMGIHSASLPGNLGEYSTLPTDQLDSLSSHSIPAFGGAMQDLIGLLEGDLKKQLIFQELHRF